MPVSKEFLAELNEGRIYHVYSKSVGGVLLFEDPIDKFHYLKTYFLFMNNFVDTWGYNLLDNHVHFIVKIKEQDQIIKHLSGIPEEFLTITQKKFLKGKCGLHTLLKQQFQRVSVSHTCYFNRVYNREGHLFNRPFNRRLVKDDNYLINLFVYIHANEVHHKIASTFEDCEWSSYNEIIGSDDTMICRKDVLDLFGGIDRFILTHAELALRYSYFDFG